MREKLDIGWYSTQPGSDRDVYDVGYCGNKYRLPPPQMYGGGANVRSHTVYIMACVDDPNLTVATSSPRTGVTLTYCVPRN